MSINQVQYEDDGASVTFTDPVAPNQLILTVGVWFPDPGAGSISVSDNVNSGNHTLVTSWVFNTARFGIFSKVCNASGTPTVSLSATNAANTLSVYYNGFSGTPTVLWSTDSASNTGVGTGVNSGSFVTSNNGEVVFALFSDTGGTNPTDPVVIVSTEPGGEDSPNGGYQRRFYDTTVGLPGGSAAGATASYATTLGTPDTWYAVVFGFYDAPLVVSQTGSLKTPGPGVSPSKGLQFKASARSQQVNPGLLSGRSYSSSYLYGVMGQVGNLTGNSYSTSNNYGQLLGTGGLVSNSYSFSFSYGNVGLAAGTAPYGRLPSPGPGLSPSSAYQFATPALETTLISTLALAGKTVSVSTVYGQATGTGALSGQSDAFSFSYGPMLLSAIGSMTGISYSFGTLWGQLAGLSLTTMSGVSYSVSTLYARAQAFIEVPIVSYPGASLTYAQAYAILLALGFTITEGEVNTEITPEGLVAQQSPAGGTYAAIGSNVFLAVSIGPYVRPPNTNLGYKVTSRTFSMEEMVSREWGPSFRAPDHRIYVWSNNQAFDSTDMGNTGIYEKGTSTS